MHHTMHGPPAPVGSVRAYTLTLSTIQATLVDLASRHHGMDPDGLIAGRPFTELCESFDSLELLDLQLRLDKALGIDLDPPGPPWPTNLHTLAEAVLQQWERERKGVPMVEGAA